jgi:hypothetical protein
LASDKDESLNKQAVSDLIDKLLAVVVAIKEAVVADFNEIESFYCLSSFCVDKSRTLFILLSIK